MRANVVPAAALVRVAILADEEVVADVPPAIIVHVHVLVGSHDCRARVLVVAVIAGATVVDHDVRRRRHRQYLEIPTLPSLPFLPTDDPRKFWG